MVKKKKKKKDNENSSSQCFNSSIDCLALWKFVYGRDENMCFHTK